MLIVVEIQSLVKKNWSHSRNSSKKMKFYVETVAVARTISTDNCVFAILRTNKVVSLVASCQ